MFLCENMENHVRYPQYEQGVTIVTYYLAAVPVKMLVFHGISHTLGKSQENHEEVGFRAQKDPLRENTHKTNVKSMLLEVT